MKYIIVCCLFLVSCASLQEDLTPLYRKSLKLQKENDLGKISKRNYLNTKFPTKEDPYITNKKTLRVSLKELLNNMPEKVKNVFFEDKDIKGVDLDLLSYYVRSFLILYKQYIRFTTVDAKRRNIREYVESKSKMLEDLSWSMDKRYYSLEGNAIKVNIVDLDDQKVKDFIKNSMSRYLTYGGLKIAPRFIEKQTKKIWGLKIIFQGNTTPYYSFDGTISLDPDEDLAEEIAQWTFAHELLHHLGFGDCYVEYFDPKRKAVIYYTLDPKDIMCTVYGNFMERHIEQLKRRLLNE